MVAVWPASLPQFVQEQGYSEHLPKNVVESQLDAGQVKRRRRFTRTWRELACVIWCDLDQRDTFEFFYETTLGGGIDPFTWVNPVTQRMALFSFRGEPPSYQPFGGENVQIRFQLHQRAEYPDFRFDSTEVTFDSTQDTFDAATR